MSNLSTAIQEAYATAQSDVFYIETLTVEHPDKLPMYLVCDNVNHELRLETGELVIFRATNFRFTLPPSGENGLQELSVSIDNINREASDYIQSVLTSQDRVTLTYRPYLSTNPETPQMVPPLVLSLTDVVIREVDVSGRGTFADVINRRFLSELYTRRRFPGL